jgi:hypothetical protein
MKTHAFDPISFICGLLATAIGLIYLIPAESSDLFGMVGDIVQWFWPVLLITLGAAVLLPLVIRGAKSDEPEDALAQMASDSTPEPDRNAL